MRAYVISVLLPFKGRGGGRLDVDQVANVERRVSLWNAQQLWIPLADVPQRRQRHVWRLWRTIIVKNKKRGEGGWYLCVCSPKKLCRLSLLNKINNLLFSMRTILALFLLSMAVDWKIFLSLFLFDCPLLQQLQRGSYIYRFRKIFSSRTDRVVVSHAPSGRHTQAKKRKHNLFCLLYLHSRHYLLLLFFHPQLRVWCKIIKIVQRRRINFDRRINLFSSPYTYFYISYWI